MRGAAVPLGVEPLTGPVAPVAPGLTTVTGGGLAHGLGQNVRARGGGGAGCSLGLGGECVPGCRDVVAHLGVVVALVGSPVSPVSGQVPVEGLVITLVCHAVPLVGSLVAAHGIIWPRLVVWG